MTAYTTIRITEDSFTHKCSGVPAVGPFDLRVEGAERCPFCGQPSPRLQREIDRQSAELLRDDAHARREQDGQLKSELRGYMPDVEWIEPRPDMGEPGGYQEIEPIDENEIPF